jgi:hypothetical protein
VPRAKRIHVLTFADGRPEATAEFWQGVHAVLVAANQGPQGRPERLPHALALQEALVLLADGQDAHLSPGDFTLRQCVMFDHLNALVRSGNLHLYQCGHCRHWGLTEDKRRHRCTRVACQRAAGAQRAGTARRRERDRQRRARAAVGVTLKGTKRPA